MTVGIEFKCVDGVTRSLKWEDVPEGVRFGLYIIQSKKSRSLFRIGASGVGTSSKSTLKERLKAHTGKENPFGNITQRKSPWMIVWFATFGGADKQATLLAEIALMAEAAKRYCFVHQSIFHCDDTEPAQIATFAQSHHNLIREVVEFQMAKFGTLPPDLQDLRRGEPSDVGFRS